MTIECALPPPAVREQLPTRRGNSSFPFEHEGHQYRATAGWFADGRLAEIFLHAPGKLGTALQSNADTAAILTSLLLQHGVDPGVIRHSITGPIAIALDMVAEMERTP
jgi:ribonucleoside-diphosphate reductase alpha chain